MTHAGSAESLATGKECAHALPGTKWLRLEGNWWVVLGSNQWPLPCEG